MVYKYKNVSGLEIFPVLKMQLHFQKENIFNLLLVLGWGRVGLGSGIEPVRIIKQNALNPGIVDCGLCLASRKLSCSDNSI